MTGPEADAGTAKERTALAWQRTALSLVAASAIMARLTWSTLGMVAIATLLTALLLGAWILVESRAGYSHNAGTPICQHSRGGRAALALAVATILIAAIEVAALLLGWLEV